MTRSSFLKSLLVAPFAGFVGKKLWPWKMNRSFVPPVIGVDLPFNTHEGASLIPYYNVFAIKRTPRKYYRL